MISDVNQASPSCDCRWPLDERMVTHPARHGETRLTHSGGLRFDVLAFGGLDPNQEDTEGMLSAVRYIDSLVQQEVDAGIPAERIVVGGFSQGKRSLPL